MNPYNVSYFKPHKTGVTKMGHNGSISGNGVAFAFDAEALFGLYKEIGVIIYNDNTTVKIPFVSNYRTGSVFGLCIEKAEPIKNLVYNFYADDSIIVDKYAKSYKDNSTFGDVNNYKNIKSVYFCDDFDWENDINPKIPYEDSILYGLNIRSFTKDKSSKVKAKGYFEGVCEKIPYLKELGITGLVLMPSYEFDECEFINKVSNPKTVDETLKQNINSAKQGMINCWGFTKGYYYAPKTSYSYSDNPVHSFKNLVKKMHKNNIEVIMHMYFPKEISQSDIIDILRFWVNEYHIDGFRISGEYLPVRAIINDALLKDTKLWFNYLSYDDVNEHTIFNDRYLAVDNGNYRNDIRKFLKSDEGLINTFINYHKNNPKKCAVINYICDYDGFTLNDLYSYERKHNEANGEDNIDGNNDNNSWNCGIEGPTKKKNIINLRLKQIKNALTLLFICQGTPYLFSGDEFGNSNNGNNNAYCQDNENGYINWKNNNFSNEILDFTKEIINLRKTNSIFHMKDEFKNLDSISCGYPDLSYHGIEAWRPELQYNSRILGMYLCGKYTKDKNGRSFYIGINMHWENHRLAVPKLLKNERYKKIIDTSIKSGDSKLNEIPVGERAIVVYEVVDK